MPKDATKLQITNIRNVAGTGNRYQICQPIYAKPNTGRRVKMINHIYVIDKTKLVRAKVVTFLFIAKRELVKPFKIKVFIFFFNLRLADLGRQFVWWEQIKSICSHLLRV
jgi:hypothetical protein